MDTAKAKAIVDAVIAELADRHFDAIAALEFDDPEIYADLHAACVARVQKAAGDY